MPWLLSAERGTQRRDTSVNRIADAAPGDQISCDTSDWHNAQSCDPCTPLRYVVSIRFGFRGRMCYARRMGLVEYILICAAVGILIYLLRATGKVEPAVMNVIVTAAVIVLVLILIRALGLLKFDVPIPQIR